MTFGMTAEILRTTNATSGTIGATFAGTVGIFEEIAATCDTISGNKFER
jgi:hypothetical protein